MVHVLTTYSGKGDQINENLRWGIRNGRWGLRQEPVNWRPGLQIDWHVIGSKAAGLRHGPRSQPAEWVTATIDVYVFKVLSPLRYELTPFWPDEIETHTVDYPYRFEFELEAQASRVSTAYDSPIPRGISDGIRRAAARAEPVLSVDDAAFDSFVETVRSAQKLS